MKKLLASLAMASVVGVTAPSAMANEQTFLTVGTGGQTGVYYQVGQSVCRFVNRDHQDLRCNAPSTGGSIANVNGMIGGEYDMGVVQSDVQYKALTGAAPFESANTELKALFSLYPEPFTILARADADIRNFDDMYGKRVNIGNPGSGQRDTMETVLNAKGKSVDDFGVTLELQAQEMAAALSDNKVDAIAYTVGHPNGSIQEATTTTDARLVNVDGPAIEKLIADNSFYAEVIIPGGMYRGNDEDTVTFGSLATFVAGPEMSEDVAYKVVSSVFENFDRFKRLHPAFANLNPEAMIQDGLSMELHPGAVKYYREQGWM
ncbi:TAXI family TRAP transporter solute-binding subunit [Salinibius halmophilus]|uniref:TAXI family TRAP transporter solute-binding subunit n=1 Tax=Salinibius halmophilus TaxID=1853216 RepID=UPI000E660B15|nr:TAXI family TRAP transporter solute-binding subunit [Salinibius halmophilus]